MTEREKPSFEDIQKGHVPLDEDHGVRGGYQPETSEAGDPPTGGGGGKEPADKE